LGLSLPAPIRQYFGSIAGRLFVILLIAVLGSATLALEITDMHRRSDLKKIRVDRFADRMEDFLLTANRISGPLRLELLAATSGVRPATGRETVIGTDAALSRRLTSRIGISVRADRAAPFSCLSPNATAPASAYRQSECWIISTTLHDGSPLRLVLVGSASNFAFPALSPGILLLLAGGMAALTYGAARMAAAPLGELSRAARALGGDLDRSPLPERGPYEVREAARAFNAMQAKLRSHVVERTHILASITHDLKTPLTRLRLRLEKIEDSALRSRLIDDLGAMDALIREGLDFSRSAQTEEPFSPLDLDALLESVVEDAAEGGRPATLVQRCRTDVEARPRALQRCLSNLLDNALNYGGSAEVAAEGRGDRIVIKVRDHGPGIPADKLEAVFAPFVRLETSRSRETGGVGLGLTIAKALAQKNNADLVLINHPEGGLEARLTIPCCIRATAPGRAPPTPRSGRPK